MDKTFIDANQLQSLLEEPATPDLSRINAILSKGRDLEGLTLEEAAYLMNSNDPEVQDLIFETAAWIKNKIYGDRLVLFAPLYLNNHCVNDCAYCGFHKSNPATRKKLTQEEIIRETTSLINMGHKRLLLEFGEDPVNNPIDYIVEAIQTVYSVKNDKGEIRRVNINIASTTTENYAKIKACEVGTYQLFQETYHQETYKTLHKGPKSDYARQLYALDKAFEAGIDDVGLGVLFGLYDWRFEVLGLLSHAAYLKERFDVGPHTISVPRFKPASTVSLQPLYPVADADFLKLIAILRIAVSYTGMIITTRETAEIREKAVKLGITQASAASCTSPGGFSEDTKKGVEQFELADKRSLDEVALTMMQQGFTPSFCTACYRRERTGSHFMDLAIPGDIQLFCQPNSILTLMEYLEDHGTPESKKLGLQTIEKELGTIENQTIKRQTLERLDRIKNGDRDLYF